MTNIYIYTLTFASHITIIVYWLDSGGRSNTRGERTNLRGGYSRRGSADIKNEQEDDAAYTRRWQGAALLHYQSADWCTVFQIPGARASAAREPSWQSPTTQPNVSSKFSLLHDY